MAGDENLIALAARHFLRWMWGQSAVLRTDHAAELADVGAGRVLPVILKFYSSDREATKAIVLDLLDRLGQVTSGPHEAFRLVHDLRSVIENDPDVAVKCTVGCLATRRHLKQRRLLAVQSFK